GLRDANAEANRLETILSRSSDPLLAFGNDADDMRAPGKGINPDVNIYDLSDDPVAYAIERCEFVRDLIPQITERYIEEGENYHELRQAYLILTGEQATQTGIMTRQIGGVRYDRSMNGDNDGIKPLDPVSEEDQKAAMAALSKYVFAPDAFQAPSEIFNHMLPQRRGFNHFIVTDDPKLQERYMGIQANCIAHILHPNTTARILNSANYGNTYTLDEVMTDLTDAIFKADLRKKVNVTRQNLQVMYVKRLVKMIQPKSKYRYSAQAMAMAELNRIKKMCTSASSPDQLTKAHRAYLIQLINQAKETPLITK
ncbi:MAG: zinc-dependent metalloprotease, partial [Flavobacteriales bacterium]|nr:zinc-dependent metalloprotease [Flavobacteriales bacterium]